MSDSDILQRLAISVTEGNDLEGLVRPFLEILEEVTGLESTYLTRIDRDKGLQHIVYSHNTQTQRLNIPEGLSVDWDDTLCKRALDENRPFTDDVDTCWGDSEAARALGIGTYLSQPIRIGDGELYGTLCGASGARKKVSTEAGQLLSMLARLIARQIERDLLLEQLRRENEAYSQEALTDLLTGIPNRRALVRELDRALAYQRRSGGYLHVAFIDLDGFKQINDHYGHDAGDRFLIQVAKKLSEEMRESDFVARYGGDEFIFFAPASGTNDEADRQTVRNRLEKATTGTFGLNGESISYQGASVGVISSRTSEEDSEGLIARADEEMYRLKQSRRSST